MPPRNKAPLTQPVPRFSEPGSSVVFDRLQFRTATNNTTRKKANAGSIISQQFFSVAVEILAKLETGEFYRVCESKMEKGVVVRGRAPVHFQHDPPIEHPTTKRAAAIRAAKKVEENVAALRAPSPILEEEELKRPAPPVMPGSAMNLSVPMQKFSQGRQPYGMYSQQIQQAYGQGIPFQAQQNLYMQYPQQSPLQQYTGAQSQQSHQQQSGPYPSYTQYPFLGSQQSFPLSGASIGSQSMGYGMMSQSAQPAQNSYYNSSGIHSLLQPLPHSLPQPRSDQAHYAQAMPQSSSARTHMQQQQSGMYGQSMASSSFAQPYQNQSHQLFQHSTGDGQPQPQQQQPMYSTNNFFQPSATPQQSYSSYLSSTPQSIEGSGTQATQQLYHQTSNTVSGIESTPAYNGSVSVSGLDKPEMRNGGGNVYGGYSTETQQQIKRPVRDEAEESDDEYFGEGEDEDDEYAPRAKKR
ncbi:hypothetical protein HDU83_000701 [Entophlyctis luteolus]|nr:hypothetical protein HDU83_000701 [Entophlyctis luteolus]